MGSIIFVAVNQKQIPIDLFNIRDNNDYFRPRRRPFMFAKHPYAKLKFGNHLLFLYNVYLFLLKSV
jgi:hypothetical protein